MRVVRWSSGALDDLDAIADYIAKDNRPAALRVWARIQATARRLSSVPVGRKGRVAGTYEMVVTGLPYIVCYQVDDEALIVVRVIHGARNWPPGRWPEG